MFLGGHESADTQEPANISFKLLLIGGHQSSVVGYLIIRFLVVYKRGIKKKKTNSKATEYIRREAKRKLNILMMRSVVRFVYMYVRVSVVLSLPF